MSEESPALPPERVATILDSINDGVFTVDKHWRVYAWVSPQQELPAPQREDCLRATSARAF